MYNHKEIEKKWQNYWEQHKTFKSYNPGDTNFDVSKKGFYALDMFPYPSGAGLHVGHPEGYTANDIIARYKKAKGYNVLHPMGWDAFGLPAENYAIKTGTNPAVTTKENIDNFRSQIKSLGFSYDWDREINTTDPSYYKWTQWIFLKMFEHGLAYEQDLPINYCPSCKTGLANEEVLNDFTCERCGTKVEKKKIRQWVLAITKYADRLLDDVDKLDWPENIKEMQRNWIGKSEGCEFEMQKENDETKKISVYTTRIDTVFGMTYAVLAPDHKDIYNFITPEQLQVCENYIEQAAKKSDQDRTAENKDKTGVFTGSYVINPFNGEKVPLWIADYVLGNYGTGAVMAVPAHDERDFAFAKKYDLPIVQSIGEKFVIELGKKEDFISHTFNEKLNCFIVDGELKSAITKFGILINSQNFSGLTSQEAQTKLTAYAEEKGFGKKKINYKLRDWLFSRQRYWGEPIPLIHLDTEDVRSLPRVSSLDEPMEKNKAYVLKTEANSDSDPRTLCSKGKEKSLVINGTVVSKIYSGITGDIICDYNLPLELPEIENYEPEGDGNSPLAKVESFIQVTLADNLSGKRETNTMPQWGGSCWYYLRFMDPHNPEKLVGAEAEAYWDGVDSYVGGAEHAVLHLLYARFWHKFLYDLDIVKTDEPFHTLRNQGMILSYAYQNKSGKLIANDEVVEKNGKFYEKNTGEELEQVVAKMSKSLKNVINPDDIIEEYGADALRLYEMYMADFKDSAPWDTKNIIGVKRFLDKTERLFTEEAKISTKEDSETMKLLHKTIQKVEEDIENYKFNTAIAALMILVNNGLPKDEQLHSDWKTIYLRLLHPFAPHLAEELWQRIGKKESLFFSTWPEFDKNLVTDDKVTIGVQVMGKVRGQIQIAVDEDKEAVLQKAKENENVAKWLEDKEIVKEIYVPGKILNILIK